MGLNCDPVDRYSAGKVSGQPRAYREKVQILDLKMLYNFAFTIYDVYQSVCV